MTQPKRAKAEDAPDLETPETKAEAPVEAPRDEEPELETPETKRDMTVHLDARKLHEATVQYAMQKAAVVPTTTEKLVKGAWPDADEIVELHRHVAPNSTNAHAPVWLGREPNSP